MSAIGSYYVIYCLVADFLVRLVPVQLMSSTVPRARQSGAYDLRRSRFLRADGARRCYQRQFLVVIVTIIKQARRARVCFIVDITSYCLSV
jgi:hypothetical protein